MVQKNNIDILISSSSLDELSWRPVANNLSTRGYEVLVYEADKVATGEVPFRVKVDDSRMEVCYGGNRLDLHKIAAAWRRRPNMFIPDQTDWVKQFQLDEERKHMQSALWSAIPEEAWLNSPSRMRKAEDKIGQLLVASELGFDIPKTIVSNSWAAVNDGLPEDIILKMHFGVIYGAENIRALYTTRFVNSPEELPLSDNPFPGYWQPYLEKAREWRITVVGDEAFDVSIYTDERAKDDWRKPENTTGIIYRREQFPDDQKEKCFKFLGHYGLKFGAFDFVEDSEGKITFLECNPNGQFGWLEERLNLPISSAISDELVKIAKCQKELTA